MFKQFTTSLAIIAFAASCASTPSNEPRGAAKFAEDPRLGEKVNRFCFTNSISGFTPLDDDTVVVRARVNDHYLLEILGFCPELDFAQTVGFNTRSSCINRGDRLIVSTSAFSLNDGGIGPDVCIINGIYKWDKDAEAEKDETPEESDAASEQETTAAP